MTVDAADDVWVGTSRGELLRMDRKSGRLQATAFGKSTDISPPAPINGLLARPDGSLLIATEQAGLFCWKDNRVIWHVDETSSWLHNRCVYSLLADEDGYTLVGSWTGLSVIAPNGEGRYLPRVGTMDISTTHILSIRQTGRQDYWLGLIGGILHLQGDFALPGKMDATLYTYVGQKGCSPPHAGAAAERDEKGNANYRIGGVYRLFRDAKGRLWARPANQDYCCTMLRRMPSRA